MAEMFSSFAFRDDDSYLKSALITITSKKNVVVNDSTMSV